MSQANELLLKEQLIASDETMSQLQAEVSLLKDQLLNEAAELQHQAREETMNALELNDSVLMLRGQLSDAARREVSMEQKHAASDQSMRQLLTVNEESIRLLQANETLLSEQLRNARSELRQQVLAGASVCAQNEALRQQKEASEKATRRQEGVSAREEAMRNSPHRLAATDASWMWPTT